MLPVKVVRWSLASRRAGLSRFLTPPGFHSTQLENMLSLYSKNEFNIPIPSFTALFMEHTTAPSQIFCVVLWCIGEYWYFSLFMLFMLIIFEFMVIFQASLFLCEAAWGLY